MSSKQPAPAKQKWYQQVRETYSFAAKEVSLLPLKLAGIFVVVFALIFGVVGIALKWTALGALMGLSSGLLATLISFGKIAEKAAYSSIDGQIGAAASVLNTLRGAWFTTPGIGVDKNQNLVHRVVGRPGIILVAEGSRPQTLLAEQKRMHARYAPGVPIHEIVVGPGDTAIADLNKTVKKFSKSLRPAEVTDVRRRLNAIPVNAFPIPKGPMPTSRKVSRR